MIKITQWMVGACMLLSLIACSEPESDLKQWMQSSSQNLRGQVDPLPLARAYQPFEYNVTDRLDPFNPQKLLLAKLQRNTNAPDLQRSKEILENFDLEKLKMVGTLNQKGVFYALIQTPNGNVYQVRQGNYMGLNFGLIKKVSETEIELLETVEDTSGEWVPRTTTINLDEQGQSK